MEGAYIDFAILLGLAEEAGDEWIVGVIRSSGGGGIVGGAIGILGDSGRWRSEKHGGQGGSEEATTGRSRRQLRM